MLDKICQLARDAGDAIMQVYDGAQPMNVVSKADDSPVTAADIAAHGVIMKGLQASQLCGASSESTGISGVSACSPFMITPCAAISAAVTGESSALLTTFIGCAPSYTGV